MRRTIPLAAMAAFLLLAGTAAAEERTLTAFDGKDPLRWQTVNDGVMGGRSIGDFRTTGDGTLRFAGTISLENNGGFSSIRTRTRDLELGGYEGLQIRVRGDGRTYKLSLRTSGTSRWIAYWADFDTVKGEWTTVRIPFSKWVPTTFGRKLDGPRLQPARVNSVGFMLYDKKAGPFSLEVDSIAAYKGRAASDDRTTKRGATIVDRAKEAGNFTVLLAAAQAAGLVEALSSAGPITVFAPTDEAFAALPDGTVEKLLEPENRDALKTVLMHHVVARDVGLPALLRGSALTMLSGQRLTVRSEKGALRIGEAGIAATEVRGENGVIHVVGRVLLPELRDLATVAAEAGTFETLVKAAQAAGLVDALTGRDDLTVFAPTDEAFAALPEGTLEKLLRPENKEGLKRILLHHVVKGRVYSDSAAAAGEAPTLAGTVLRFGYEKGLAVDGVRIARPDLAARNGTIHVIDAVLLPPAIEAPKPTAAPTVAARSARLIERAIDIGVPLFNDGNPEACRAVYEIAAVALLGFGDTIFSPRVRAMLTDAIDSTKEPREKAWELRRALDAALREARSARPV